MLSVGDQLFPERHRVLQPRSDDDARLHMVSQEQGRRRPLPVRHPIQGPVFPMGASAARLCDGPGSPRSSDRYIHSHTTCPIDSHALGMVFGHLYYTLRFVVPFQDARIAHFERLVRAPPFFRHMFLPRRSSTPTSFATSVRRAFSSGHRLGTSVPAHTERD
jgi:hypothetical protein